MPKQEKKREKKSDSVTEVGREEQELEWNAVKMQSQLEM